MWPMPEASSVHEVTYPTTAPSISATNIAAVSRDTSTSMWRALRARQSSPLSSPSRRSMTWSIAMPSKASRVMSFTTARSAGS